MGYASLAQCVQDLEKQGDLVRIDEPLDPFLEIAYIQRRAFAAKSPALLFTRPKDCAFPMLANLFGTKTRVNYIFRDTLEKARFLFQARAELQSFFKTPLKALAALPSLWHMRPKFVPETKAPILACRTSLRDLPKLVSWPEDGGSFITLPLAYSEDPCCGGLGNLGMYRIQLDGNDYADNEAGLHYQLQRGIGIHHAKALAAGIDLPVNIHVGGPPALIFSAVMPLPEGMSELVFAGLLGGRRVELARTDNLPVLTQADFVLQCVAGSGQKPEGPFGDHLGYYSLRHFFPVMKVKSVHHRPDAIWPFTSVGRPPQEDTMFGDLVHELTAPMVSHVFEGIEAVHAVDAAGVHPLLLAMGSERYAPYEARRRPLELLTQAMHLLGTTQTALAKFVLLAAREDAPGLSCRDTGAFLRHMLERTDFGRDLHFLGNSACDTLDYSGYALHTGSRLIWTAAGDKIRELGSELRGLPQLPPGFVNLRLAMPGILLVEGPKHAGGPLERDARIKALADSLEAWPQRERFPLAVVVDDAKFCAASLENFLWATFTRTDPARDCYGLNERANLKHWTCEPPLVMDARLKAFQAPPLEDDPQVVERVEALACKGAPLHGLI